MFGNDLLLLQKGSVNQLERVGLRAVQAICAVVVAGSVTVTVRGVDAHARLRATRV